MTGLLEELRSEKGQLETYKRAFHNTKKSIFFSIVKLNSQESKELLQKWLREGRIKDHLLEVSEEESYKMYLLQKLVENSLPYSDYYEEIEYDFIKFSPNELISSLNELIDSASKKIAKVNELEKAVEELEIELEEKDNEIEELEERVEIEQEQVKAVVACGEKYSKAQAEDIKEKLLMLQNSEKRIADEVSKNKGLWEELKEKSKMLSMSEKREGDLKEQLRQLYLETKPLPTLPKEENMTLTKQSIFKQLKTKAKVKVQQLQKLVKREKFHNQEMVAKIEVSTK